jgi:hypothetical protein
MDWVDPHYLAVLQVLLALLAGKDVNWALTGSLGHALQGVPVQPQDIDLQTDKSGAYAIMDTMSEFALQPVAYLASENIRSHLGALLIEGVRVEVMGAVEKRLADGSWAPPPDLDRHRRFVMVSGMRVPVLGLAYEAGAYELLGRHERVALIRQVLNESRSK